MDDHQLAGPLTRPRQCDGGRGIAVMRLRLTLRTMHPQLAGLSHSWVRERVAVASRAY